MDGNLRNHEIHYRYWIVILVFLLIVAVTVNWTTQPKFTEYIGNAATLISLVLGVVAIFYSYISNNSLSSSLGNISTASESLKGSEIEIKSVLEHSKLLASNHQENIRKLSEISDSVQTSVLTLSRAMEEVSAKTTELQSTVREVPSQLGVIAGKLEQKNQVQPVVRGKRAFTREEALYFNSSAPIYGNFVTYGCVLAKIHRIPLSVNQLNRLLERQYDVESPGFFQCMLAGGIVDARRSTEKGGDYFDIVGVDSEVARGIKDYFVGFLDSEAYNDKPERRALLKGMLEKMERAFASGNISVDE
ncbi:hypothetical protein POK33_12670 [Burkholderia cenocepacia]|uniref:hypothetical protein n=1 Tax=Burkholderia cenocepacia TaxID=95486 RepID=UPI0023BA20B8|nr:hypothetical protein [Burkholderia cenocepacia]MDF0501572.1 hypothetical protein [Burkholderia cenocepacia]